MKQWEKFRNEAAQLSLDKGVLQRKRGEQVHNLEIENARLVAGDLHQILDRQLKVKRI